LTLLTDFPRGGLRSLRGRRPGIGPGWQRRILDLIVATVALLLLIPVFVLVAIIVGCTSPGSVFFRQVRVGQGSLAFVMFKFRTMRPGAGGPEVTPADDLRVTPIGRLLRTTGIDELPQLFNVLRGDMTLVGPRPETPALARRYPSECKLVFQHRPALTGPSQVRLRDKDVLPVGDAMDLEAHYLRDFVPVRTALDLEYLADPSLRRTFGFLLETASYLLRPVRRALGRCRARLFAWRSEPAPHEMVVVDLTERVAQAQDAMVDLRDDARDVSR
jgi:lipopolysaccharide/colanic/teichoic acid biosynthesis glycosyltransferase